MQQLCANLLTVRLNMLDKLAVRKCHKKYASHPLISTVCAHVQDIAQLVQSAADEDDDDDEEEEESPAKPSQGRGGKKGKPAAAVSSSYRRNYRQKSSAAAAPHPHFMSCTVHRCSCQHAGLAYLNLCLVLPWSISKKLFL